MSLGEFDLSARLTDLLVYPVKSCAGVSLREAVLTDQGLDLDRLWMVVDEAGDFVTQRELPRMVLIQPRVRIADVVLRAPGMLALHLALEQAEAPCRVRIWGQEFPAYDMGAVAAQWFTDFLGRKLRLVRFDPEVQRLASARWTGGVEAANAFSDGFPLLVASEASLAELNARLAAQGRAPVSMARFRPNIVLGGLEAHDEDRASEIELATGGAEPVVLRPVKPCPRCPIPNIDPTTAAIDPIVSDTLQAYRRNPIVDGAVSFGMNAIALRGVGQTLRVGQDVGLRLAF